MIKDKKTKFLAIVVCAILAFFVGRASFNGIVKVITRFNGILKNDEVTEEPDTKEAICPQYRPEYHYGKVSYYDRTYCEKHNPGCRTVSGEVFDENAFTAACSYNYQLQTLLRFHYKDRVVVVRCNDRGDFEKYGRVADLSKEAFESLASPKKDEEVKFEVVSPKYEAFNQYRENKGLPKIKRNEDLEKSAYESAKAIHEGERDWNHDGYTDYIRKYGGFWRFTAENLARDFVNFDETLSAWHLSRSHKENLQSKKYCEIGIGQYGDIWVLHLGRRE